MNGWWSLALVLGACADPTPAAIPQALVHEPVLGLAVGGGFAYYTSTGGAIKRVSLDGGDAQTLAFGVSPTGAIALSDKNVYWANGGNMQGEGRIMKAPLAGGLPQTVAQGLHFPAAIAIDASDVYFVETCCSNQAVWRVSKDGGAPVKLADIPARTFAWGLALDRGYVYWTEDAFGAGDGQIKRIAKGTTNIEVLVASQPGVAGVAVDGWNVYWYVSTNNFAPTNAVRRRALAGGPIVDIAGDHAQTIAADGRFVWWGTVEPHDGGGTSRLRRMGAAGTDAATWFLGKQVGQIGFDVNRVAWTDLDEPAIFVMPR